MSFFKHQCPIPGCECYSNELSEVCRLHNVAMVETMICKWCGSHILNTFSRCPMCHCSRERAAQAPKGFWKRLKRRWLHWATGHKLSG